MYKINYRSSSAIIARFRDFYLRKYDKLIKRYRNALYNSMLYGDEIDEDLRREYLSSKKIVELIAQLEFELREIEMKDILRSTDAFLKGFIDNSDDENYGNHLGL